MLVFQMYYIFYHKLINGDIGSFIQKPFSCIVLLKIHLIICHSLIHLSPAFHATNGKIKQIANNDTIILVPPMCEVKYSVTKIPFFCVLKMGTKRQALDKQVSTRWFQT